MLRDGRQLGFQKSMTTGGSREIKVSRSTEAPLPVSGALRRSPRCLRREGECAGLTFRCRRACEQVPPQALGSAGTDVSPQETDLHGGAHTEVWNPLHVLIGELRVEPSPVLLFRERAEEADKWEWDHGGDIFDVSETRWTLSVDSSPERGVEEACSPLYLCISESYAWPLCQNGSLHGLPSKLEGIGHRK